MDHIFIDPYYRQIITEYLCDDRKNWINLHLICKDLWITRDLGVYYEFRTQKLATTIHKKLIKHSKTGTVATTAQYNACISKITNSTANAEWLQYFLEYHRNKFTGSEYALLIVGNRFPTLRNQMMDFDMFMSKKVRKHYKRQSWVKALDTNVEIFICGLKAEIARLEKLKETKYTLPYSRYLCNLIFGTIIKPDRSSFSEAEIFTKLTEFCSK